jgi:hypothetical protein
MPELLGSVVLPYTIVQQSAIVITGAVLQSNNFTFDFTAPAGNLPGTQNNNMFLWTGTNDPPTMVPWFSTPYSSTTLIDGIQSGQINPPQGQTIPSNPYVMGYSVGPAVTTAGVTTYPNVCATAMIPSSWDPAKITYFQPSIGLAGMATNSITFSYALPQGTVPSTNLTWIGFWRNVLPLYNIASAPIGYALVNQPDSSGFQGFLFAQGLSPNTYYTAGLFTSGYAKTAGGLTTTALAATVSWLTGQG